METSPASDPTPPEPKRFPPVIIYTVGIAIILMVLWSVFLQRSMAPYQVRSSKIELRNYSMIEDFSLTDHRNEALTREDLDGKIWVTNFIFTSCARECPILNQKMARLQEEFLSQPKVEFVSISVDPETDKPERLAKYAKAFAAGERWHFLTGEVEAVDQLLQKSFLLVGATAEDRSRPDRENTLAHSERIAVVDQLGIMRYSVDGMREDVVEVLIEVVERLLTEDSP